MTSGEKEAPNRFTAESSGHPCFAPARFPRYGLYGWQGHHFFKQPSLRDLRRFDADWALAYARRAFAAPEHFRVVLVGNLTGSQPGALDAAALEARCGSRVGVT